MGICHISNLIHLKIISSSSKSAVLPHPSVKFWKGYLVTLWSKTKSNKQIRKKIEALGPRRWQHPRWIDNHKPLDMVDLWWSHPPAEASNPWGSSMEVLTQCQVLSGCFIPKRWMYDIKYQTSRYWMIVWEGCNIKIAKKFKKPNKKNWHVT